MDRLSENKIILVCRKTRLDELVTRFNTIDQARFYVEHLGADFSDYVLERETYRAALKQTQVTLESLGRLQTIDRTFLPNFLFGDHDIVVVLGQDGLVANTVKYLSRQLVIGVNPDPKRWDGVLLPFTASDLSKLIPEVFTGARPLTEVTMAKAQLNDGQSLYAVNDLFIGPKSHISARYIIRQGSREEQHSSSGLIVSTGLGSTGWLKSLLAGAVGVASSLARTDLHLSAESSFPWDANYLRFTVREPFPSRTSSASLVFGTITNTEPLQLISQMPEHGVIFSDGIESDFLEFNSGSQATITTAERKGRLVV